MRRLWLLSLIYLMISVVPVLSQSSARDSNLSNCANGWGTCDYTALTPSQATDVAASKHRRAVSDCMRGYQSCDYSELSMAEAKRRRGEQEILMQGGWSWKISKGRKRCVA